MASRNSTNEDWWSEQGVIRSKAILTFADNTSVEVYGTDYIKSWKVTQDLSSGNDKPVFDFVSDKLDMTLFSLDNDFNPFAETSQYYGKFVLGVKIDLFVKIDYLGNGDELNWDPLGQYRIAEIDVSGTGTECNILAYTYGFDGIENSTQKVLTPPREIATKADASSFLEDVLPGYTVVIDIDHPNLPKKLFPMSNKLETINEFLEALYCFSRCDGNTITISSFDSVERATLDRTNILSLTPKQSLVRVYDDSMVKWNELSLKPYTEIVSLTADFAVAGVKTYPNIAFEGYINKIEDVICTSLDTFDIVDVTLSNIYSGSITLQLENLYPGQVDVRVKAETIIFNELTEGDLDSDNNVCEISNKYIQTKEHAAALKLQLDQFITTQNQYIGAAIRFNPLLQPAWLVSCNHDDYGVDVEGYIVEQSLELSDSQPGGRHTVTLLNREAVL